MSATLTPEGIREEHVTSTHEAGHAVAMVALGLPLYDARIWWKTNWRGWGQCRGQVRMTDHGGADIEDHQVIDHIRAALAGPVAEAMYLSRIEGRSVGAHLARTLRDSPDRDLQQVHELKHLVPGKFSLDVAAAEAQSLVTRQWSAVERLAAELRQHRSLTAREIRRVAR